MSYRHPPVWSYEYKVFYDYPFVRTEMPDEKIIFRTQHVIYFRTNLGPAESYPPREYAAVIKDPSMAAPPYFHPRAEREVHHTAFTKRIVTARMRPELNIRVEARKTEDRLIQVTIDSSKNFWRGKFWANPEKGYSLVRAEEYGLKTSSEQPAIFMTADYQKTSNGGFVLSSRALTHWISVNGALVQRSHTVMNLVDFNDDKPDPELFRLESLGLPEGGRVTDRINNKHYVYGVSAVTESDIPEFNVAAAEEREGGFRLWMALAGAALAFGVAAWVLWLRRARA
jgi:hypothetical protein